MATKRTSVILCVGGIISKAKADALGMRVGKNLGLPCYQDETFKSLLQDEYAQETATVDSLLTVLRERCTGERRMRSLSDTSNVVIYLDVPEAETIKQNQLVGRGRKYGDANGISPEYLRLLMAAYARFMQEVAQNSGPGRMVVKVSSNAVASVNASDLADAISAKCRICPGCRKTVGVICLPVCENDSLTCNCKQTKFRRTNLDAVIGTVAKLDLSDVADTKSTSPPSSPSLDPTTAPPNGGGQLSPPMFQLSSPAPADMVIMSL